VCVEELFECPKDRFIGRIFPKYHVDLNHLNDLRSRLEESDRRRVEDQIEIRRRNEDNCEKVKKWKQTLLRRPKEAESVDALSDLDKETALNLQTLARKEEEFIKTANACVRELQNVLDRKRTVVEGMIEALFGNCKESIDIGINAKTPKLSELVDEVFKQAEYLIEAFSRNGAAYRK
ncbi:hypothetical protein PFISCL1PPCAC_7054, partial [Pristionchus fissidentatus]